MAHVDGTDDNSGYGVSGTSTNLNGVGVKGTSKEGHGVSGTGGGMKKAGVYATAANPECYAVLAESASFTFTVLAINNGGTGNYPNDVSESGVLGDSSSGPGVSGTSGKADGVFGQGNNGVHGRSVSATGCGLRGENTSPNPGNLPATGSGVVGTSLSVGVFGLSGPALPAEGHITLTHPQIGVWGQSQNFTGVQGETSGADGRGVVGINWGAGIGVYGSSATGLAGQFQGNVQISGNLTAAGSSPTTGHISATGDITAAGNVKATGNVTATDVMLSGADCAEEFDVAGAGQLEPGTVVVLDNSGALIESTRPYDGRVAGVISGAGKFRPGVILDKRSSSAGRAAVALVGKVYCKVDASQTPINVGDLLTTSAMLGCAMKATDPARAFGAVLGKALTSFDKGIGLIPILVILQ